MSGNRVIDFVKNTTIVICFSALLYLTIEEVLRYAGNDDKSSIAYKRFNDSPEDKYPVITLCFYGRYGRYSTIYKKQTIEKIGMSVSKYRDVLIGNSNLTADEIDKLPEFSSTTIKLDGMISKIGTYDDRDKPTNKWNLQHHGKTPSKNSSLVPRLNTSYWPFHLSYQNPDQICYTHTTKFEKGLIKTVDYIYIDPQSLDELLGEGFLYLYVHYPGQILRNLGKEVFSLSLSERKIKRRIFIRMSGISVLRRRDDAKMPCDPTIANEDDAFLNDVVSKVKCLPPYWKEFENLTSVLKKCTSTSQLHDAYYYARYENMQYTLGKRTPPCTEMTVSSSVDTEGSSSFQLRFQYRTDQYLEMTNKRDFGARDLWSSVGGFAGIFLGYSLLQLPEILKTGFYCLLGSKICFKFHGTHET